jgi:uncharacterized protein (DUF1501 family)
MAEPAPTRCTVCEEIRLAEVRDARPSQVLPIPNAALAGFPEGRSPHALTRRRLFQLGVAGFASVYAAQQLGWESVWESAVAEAAGGPTKALVVLYLAGGQDGLNAIVPAGSTDYAIYAAKRPKLHRGQGPTAGGVVGSQVIPGTGGELAFANPLVSSTGGGDNGDPTHGLDVIYGDGSGGPGSNLAILPGTDYTPPNLSHFTSSDHWFAGQTDPVSTGWLGRYLDVYGSATNPLQGISIGGSLSKALRARSAPVSTVASSNFANLGFRAGGPSASTVKPNSWIQQLSGVPAGSRNLSLARVRQSYGLATSVFNQLSPLGAPTLGTGYPSGGNGLPGALQLAAFLLGAKLGTRVITINWGSFDTHGNQISQQDPQLVTLSRSLSAFLADLKTRGIDDRVSVLVFSEFGRRVAENGSAGTDHGAGGLMMLAGTGVNGGLAGQFPGLSTLDQTGDLLVPTDFRSVYAETISSWLGGDPTQVLPGIGAAGYPATTVTRGDGRSGLFH